MRKRVKHAIESLRRQRERVFQRIADAVRKLANLRERYPGDRRKGEKRRTKVKIKHRKEAKEALTRRIERKKKWLKEHDDPKPAPASNIGWWDGRQVAGWMVGAAPGPGGTRRNWLQEIKNHGWSGGLYSGYRSPEYSESLCFNICGQKSCPGLCAGRASNHSGLVYPGGAIDVQDIPSFVAGNAAVGGPFRNNLPSDQPHRSVSGY